MTPEQTRKNYQISILIFCAKYDRGLDLGF